MDYLLWRDWVTAYVRLRARTAGWSVVRVDGSKSSISRYVVLQRGPAVAVVRISDHRPSKKNKNRDSMFSVRQAATLRLISLDRWLDRRFQSVRNRIHPRTGPVANEPGGPSGVYAD